MSTVGSYTTIAQFMIEKKMLSMDFSVNLIKVQASPHTRPIWVKKISRIDDVVIIQTDTGNMTEKEADPLVVASILQRMRMHCK